MFQMNYNMNALLISVISRNSHVEIQAGKLSEQVGGLNDMVAQQISASEQIEKLTQGIVNARPGKGPQWWKAGERTQSSTATKDILMIPSSLQGTERETDKCLGTGESPLPTRGQ